MRLKDGGQGAKIGSGDGMTRVEARRLVNFNLLTLSLSLSLPSLCGNYKFRTVNV